MRGNAILIISISSGSIAALSLRTTCFYLSFVLVLCTLDRSRTWQLQRMNHGSSSASGIVTFTIWAGPRKLPGQTMSMSSVSLSSPRSLSLNSGYPPSEQPPKGEDYVDENGIRITVEYTINDEGKKVKVRKTFPQVCPQSTHRFG